MKKLWSQVHLREPKYLQPRCSVDCDPPGGTSSMAGRAQRVSMTIEREDDDSSLARNVPGRVWHCRGAMQTARSTPPSAADTGKRARCLFCISTPSFYD